MEDLLLEVGEERVQLARELIAHVLDDHLLTKLDALLQLRHEPGRLDIQELDVRDLLSQPEVCLGLRVDQDRLEGRQVEDDRVLDTVRVVG